MKKKKSEIKHLNIHLYEEDIEDEKYRKIVSNAIKQLSSERALTKNVKRWIYKGVLEEYLKIDTDNTTTTENTSDTSQMNSSELAREVVEELKRQNLVMISDDSVKEEEVEKEKVLTDEEEMRLKREKNKELFGGLLS